MNLSSLRAKIAANDRWSRLDACARTAATAKAREAAERRYETLVDPYGVLSAEERTRQAANARKAHYQRMALASVHARRRRQAMVTEETTRP